MKAEGTKHLVKVENLKPDELRAVRYLASELNISKEESTKMLFEEGGMNWYMTYRKNELDFDALQLIKELQSSIRAKVKKGSMEQARAGSIALGILRQKLFGDVKPGFQMNIGGRDLRINLGWNFKPYKKPEERENLVEGEVEEENDR